VPVNVFTEGSLKKVALKRRASSLEAVAHDLFEENQNLQESLEGEAKKRTKEGSKFIFIFIFLKQISISLLATRHKAPTNKRNATVRRRVSVSRSNDNSKEVTT